MVFNIFLNIKKRHVEKSKFSTHTEENSGIGIFKLVKA